MKNTANVLRTGDVIDLSTLEEVSLKFFSRFTFQNTHEMNLQIIIFLSNLKSDYKFPDFDFEGLINYMEILDASMSELEFR